MKLHDCLEQFFGFLRKLIIVFAYIAGTAVLFMILITISDIILRLLRIAIPGAYDLVRISGVIAIACALPYVTAVKGHIAIEFFYHLFSRRGRVFLDALFRLIALGLFGMLVWYNIIYGLQLKKSGNVMPTLSIPVFWIPWIISLCFALVFLTTLYHLLHPGKEMIKP